MPTGCMGWGSIYLLNSGACILTHQLLQPYLHWGRRASESSSPAPLSSRWGNCSPETLRGFCTGKWPNPLPLAQAGPTGLSLGWPPSLLLLYGCKWGIEAVLQHWDALDWGPLLTLNKICPPLGVTFIIYDMGAEVCGQTRRRGHTDVTGSREANCLPSPWSFLLPPPGNSSLPSDPRPVRSWPSGPFF